jgi:hypothetical protein
MKKQDVKEKVCGLQRGVVARAREYTIVLLVTPLKEVVNFLALVLDQLL